MKIGVVDYGMGNIHSLVGAVERNIDCKTVISYKYDELIACDKLILPGVGHFNKAIKNIHDLKLEVLISDFSKFKEKKVLGICLGMQLLCESSDEGGVLNSGLDLVPAKVRKFSPSKLPKPHIGYNQINISSSDLLYQDIKDLTDFYFVHNHRVTSDKNISQSICVYGEEFIASYSYNNIYGAQFHPELSQVNGLKYLQNFLKL